MIKLLTYHLSVDFQCPEGRFRVFCGFQYGSNHSSAWGQSEYYLNFYLVSYAPQGYICLIKKTL